MSVPKKNTYSSDEELSDEIEVTPTHKKKSSKAETVTLSADQMEMMLNTLRKEYIRANKMASEPDSDQLSVSSIVSTSSTKTNPDVKDEETYVSKAKRLFVLENFTISQLRAMHNSKGRSPQGSSKRELLGNAVRLVKTKLDLINFLISAYPEEEE